MNQADAIDPGCDGIRLLNETRKPIGSMPLGEGGRTQKKYESKYWHCTWLVGWMPLIHLPSINYGTSKNSSSQTCQRWIHLYQSEGRVLPKRDTGNHQFERKINGIDLVNIALFRLVHPKAYIDEVRAYVHNPNPVNRPFSRSQICRAEDRLGLWTKVASTTLGEAYRPVNLYKRALELNQHNT